MSAALPSRRFLAMIPPALFQAWPAGEGTPPLLAVLAALEEQWRMLAADIDTVIDDAFPDSAAPWALPYLAALLGLPADAGRHEIAYATALRRRKGTPAALEDFAEVLTGWPALVREGWTSTLWTQQLPHPVRRTASLNLRTGEHLGVGSAWDSARYSLTPGGPHHPAAVTTQVFPWQVLGYEEVQAAPLGNGRFAMHPLGIAAPLYLQPRPLHVASDAEDERSPGSLPAPRRPRAAGELPLRGSWKLLEALGGVSHGPVWTLAPEHPLTAEGPAFFAVSVDRVPLPWSRIGLTGLPGPGAPASAPAAGQVLVDPSRGVLEAAADVLGTLRTSFYRAVPGRLGPVAATEQPREDVGVVIVVDPVPGAPHPPGQTVVTTLTAAFAAASAAVASTSEPGVPQVEIRLHTSDQLAAPAPLSGAPTLTRWRVLAPVGMTPVIVGDLDVNLTDVELELDGFFLQGELRIGPEMGGVELVGLTFDTITGRGVFVNPTAWTVQLRARYCILGPIRADQSAFPITLTDCLVDGRGAAPTPCGGSPGGNPTRSALAAADRFPPDLVATGVTFVGPVGADEVWVTDCLFTNGLHTTVTSTGCVRFCHLGPGDDPAAHPPGHKCLSGPLPRFGSLGLEAAGYYAPVLTAPAATPAHPLLTGASDGGEIGAYHHARRSQNALRLAQRLPEMTPLAVHPNLSITDPED